MGDPVGMDERDDLMTLDSDELLDDADLDFGDEAGDGDDDLGGT